MKVAEFQEPRFHNFRSTKYKVSRLYFSFKHETVMDDLQNRRSRPAEKLKSLLPDIFQHYGISPKHARWSQYAGCSCPCSPGFILSGLHGKDYFVTVEGTHHA